MQLNSKWRLCSEKDETVNYMTSECSKLVQKEYKTWMSEEDDPPRIV